ncbi:MAG TPA: hypothetical protein DCL95_20970 [Rhodospirillaceae bacterium]|nr:hypothetical protein [Rhodospirillaceae bacterium]
MGKLVPLWRLAPRPGTQQGSAQERGRPQRFEVLLLWRLAGLPAQAGGPLALVQVQLQFAV